MWGGLQKQRLLVKLAVFGNKSIIVSFSLRTNDFANVIDIEAAVRRLPGSMLIRVKYREFVNWS